MLCFAPCSAVGFIILTSFALAFSSNLFSFPSVEGLIMVVFTGRCVWEPCNLERRSEIYWGLNQNSQDRYNLRASCQQVEWSGNLLSTVSYCSRTELRVTWFGNTISITLCHPSSSIAGHFYRPDHLLEFQGLYLKVLFCILTLSTSLLIKSVHRP